jgi:hypothetical protein
VMPQLMSCVPSWLAPVLAESDALKSQFEQHQIAWQKRQRTLAALERQKNSALVPYRAPPQPVVQPTPRQQAGDDWNDWWSQRMQQFYEEVLAETLGLAISEYVHGKLKTFGDDVSQRFEAEVAKLRTEMADLRADCTIQTGIARGQIA